MHSFSEINFVNQFFSPKVITGLSVSDAEILDVNTLQPQQPVIDLS